MIDLITIWSIRVIIRITRRVENKVTSRIDPLVETLLIDRSYKLFILFAIVIVII